MISSVLNCAGHSFEVARPSRGHEKNLDSCCVPPVTLQLLLHNFYDAGPADEVREIVKQLEVENIFARALDTNGVPYHSAVLQPLLGELDRCTPFETTLFLTYPTLLQFTL